MELKQNPFSVYDFLGYFVPGALFLFAAFAVSQTWLPSGISQSIAGLFQPSKLEFYLPFVLVSYLIGHVLSFVSSVTVERYSVWRVGYPSRYLLGNPFPSFFQVSPPKRTRRVVRVAVALFILPILILDLTLGVAFRLNELFARPLENVLRDTIAPRIARLVSECTGEECKSEEIKSGVAEFFLLMYHYCVEKASPHLPKMQNYVALYGFCRTIALIFVLVFWSFVAAIPLRIAGWSCSLAGAAASGCLAYIFFLDFLKFYRRFSLEVFMAFAAVYRPTQ
jgi:hypothetical protein